MAELIVVVEILIAERNANNPLHHQRLNRVLGVGRIAAVLEASRQATGQAQHPIRGPQQQCTSVAVDGATIEGCNNRAAFSRCKRKQVRVTLCRHRGLPLLRDKAFNWLRVSPGRQICLKAAAELDFQALLPDRVGSSFLEHQNGWKPPWTSDSHAVGSRTVRAICLAAPFPRQPWSRTEAGFVQDLQLCSAAALSGLSVEATADRQG